MKHLLSIILALSMPLALTACSVASAPSVKPVEEPTASSFQQTEEMKETIEPEEPEESKDSEDLETISLTEVPETTTISKDRKNLNKFFTIFTHNGNIDDIESVAEDNNLYIDHRLTGTGGDAYKIAPTQELAETIALSDFDTTEGIYITAEFDLLNNDELEFLQYNDYENMVIGYYTPSEGFSIRDLNRLTPADCYIDEDGIEYASAILKVDSAQDVVDYIPYTETEISPLENFFTTLTLGMTYQEVSSLTEESELYMAYSRHEDYITYAHNVDGPTQGSCIAIDFEDDILTEIKFYNSPVYHIEGSYIHYISDVAAESESDTYSSGSGYYIENSDSVTKFDTAEESLEYLRSLR